MVRVYEREKGKAGRDQIAILLAPQGVSIATGTVGSILRGPGLRAVRMRAWKKATTVDPHARTEHIQNHMLDNKGKRDFTSEVPGTRLCGDITHLRTRSGWRYLATVIDLSTRAVAGLVSPPGSDESAFQPHRGRMTALRSGRLVSS